MQVVPELCSSLPAEHQDLHGKLQSSQHAAAAQGIAVLGGQRLGPSAALICDGDQQLR
jgi:hypothetical protein